MVWDTFAIIILMGVMLLGNFDLKAHVSGAFHYVAGVMWAGITSLVGPFVLLGFDIDWKQMPGNKLSQHTFAVLRGLAIAMPLLLIFGALFMAADAAFEGLVNRTFNFNIDTVVSHFLLTSLFAWLTAGYFRGSLMAPFANGTRTPSSASTSPVPNAPQAEARPSDPECTSPRVSKGVASNSADEGFPVDTSSFVAKVAAEPGESGASLPNNASILEHINISDPPNAEVGTG